MQIQNLHDQHELSFSDVQNSRNFRCPTNCRCSPIMLARHWSFCFWAVMYPQKMRQAPKNRGLWADCWHQHLGSNTGRFFSLLVGRCLRFVIAQPSRHWDDIIDGSTFWLFDFFWLETKQFLVWVSQFGPWQGVSSPASVKHGHREQVRSVGDHPTT